MLNMKKVLIAGTVLTAFCASAFAAEADNNMPKPSMQERVNAIMHENDGDRPCPPPQDECRRPPHHRGHRGPGPKMTPEQRAEHEKLRQEWEKMTPEQRQKAMEKMHKERQERHEKRMKEAKERHDKHAKETMAKLTDSQKAEVEQFIKDDMAQRKQLHERLAKMTPEQREAVRANKPMPPKGPKHHKDFRHGGPRHNNGDFPPPPPMDGQLPPPPMEAK